MGQPRHPAQRLAVEGLVLGRRGSDGEFAAHQAGQEQVAGGADLVFIAESVSTCSWLGSATHGKSGTPCPVASGCGAYALVWHGAGRNLAKLAGVEGLHADRTAIEAHELDHIRGSCCVNIDDHAYVTRLQPQRGQRACQYDLIVFLSHHNPWVGGLRC